MTTAEYPSQELLALNLHPNTIAYDQDLLLREVNGIDVNWYRGYGNSPTIELILDQTNDFPYFRGILGEDGVRYDMYEEFGRLPPNSRKIYYSSHPTGFVKYFCHSGNPDVNEGGFGGAPYGVQLPDGTSKVLRGPWSSRATIVDDAVSYQPELMVVDVTAICEYRIGTAIKEMALLALLKHFKFPHHIIRQKVPEGKELQAWEVSLSKDAPSKPNKNGDVITEAVSGEIEVFYSPE